MLFETFCVIIIRIRMNLFSFSLALIFIIKLRFHRNKKYLPILLAQRLKVFIYLKFSAKVLYVVYTVFYVFLYYVMFVTFSSTRKCRNSTKNLSNLIHLFQNWTLFAFLRNVIVYKSYVPAFDFKKVYLLFEM